MSFAMEMNAPSPAAKVASVATKDAEGKEEAKKEYHEALVKLYEAEGPEESNHHLRHRSAKIKFAIPADMESELDEETDGMTEFWRRNGSFSLYDDDQASGLYDQEEAFERAYHIAKNRNDCQPWGRTKVIVVGRGGAGKSSTVRSLLGIPHEENWCSTFGIDLSVTHTGDWKKRDKHESVFQMLMAKATAMAISSGLQADDEEASVVQSFEDPSSQQQQPQNDRRSRRLLSSLQGLLTLSRRRKSSLERGGSRRGSSKRSTLTLGRQFTALERVDSDLVEKELDYEDRVVLNIWDYGGEAVLQPLHNVVLTRFGICMLVFDLRSILSEELTTEAIEEMEYWLEEVRANAADAPVLLVGTYYDEVHHEEDLAEIDSLLQDCLGLNEFNIVADRETGRHFFTMNNCSASADRACTLREALEQTALQEDFVRQEVSLSWVKFLDDLITQRSKQAFDLEKEVVPLAASRGIQPDELNGILAFFHQLGMLLYADSAELLCGTVVTDPQWLIDKVEGDETASALS